VRTNSLTGMPRGMNVFNDLLDACISTAGALRVAGNAPMSIIDVAHLGGRIDYLLDAIGAVSTAAPRAGDAFDLDAGDAQINPDRPVWSARVCADEEVLECLGLQGYLAEFDPEDHDRVRAAMESIDGADIEVHLIGRDHLTPVGIVDLVATAVQIALTGRTETPWIDAYPVTLNHPYGESSWRADEHRPGPAGTAVHDGRN
jgi:hypothetical protein